jgi:hypothetical protein
LVVERLASPTMLVTLMVISYGRPYKLCTF